MNYFTIKLNESKGEKLMRPLHWAKLSFLCFWGIFFRLQNRDFFLNLSCHKEVHYWSIWQSQIRPWIVQLKEHCAWWTHLPKSKLKQNWPLWPNRSTWKDPQSNPKPILRICRSKRRKHLQWLHRWSLDKKQGFHSCNTSSKWTSHSWSICPFLWSISKESNCNPLGLPFDWTP